MADTHFIDTTNFSTSVGENDGRVYISDTLLSRTNGDRYFLAVTPTTNGLDNTPGIWREK